MVRRYLTFKLDTHPVDGDLSLDQDENDLPRIQAVLQIPEQGRAREAFNAYLKNEREDARMTLDWIEEEDGNLFGYTAEGVIVNRQFPATRFAIFNSVGSIQQKVFEL